MKHITKIILIGILLFALMSIQSASNLDTRPNLILIVVDDMGWSQISAPQPNMGNISDFYETPNIERMANEGVSFPQNYVNGANCAPTRSAIISGQYGSRPTNNVFNVHDLNRGNDSTLMIGPEQGYNGDDHIRPEAITIAETIADAGYVTAHFGKYHVGDTYNNNSPTEQGFDYNYGGNEAGAPGSYFAAFDSTWTFHSRVGEELDAYAAPYTAQSLALAGDTSLTGTPKHLTDAMTEAGLDFLDANKNTPFFMYFSYYAIHGPFGTNMARPDLRDKYIAKAQTNPSAMGHYTKPGQAAIGENMDQSIGRLLDYLENTPDPRNPGSMLAANTMVYLISDNGGAVSTDDSGPLRAMKGAYYEGGIRTTGIAWSGGLLANPGTVNDNVVIGMDLYPTFVELADGTLPPNYDIDGESILPLLDGTATSLNREAVFWHFPGYLVDNKRNQRPVSIIRKGDFKLIYNYESKDYELYDVVNDLSETTNLLTNPDYDLLLTAHEMSSRLAEHLIEVDAPLPTYSATGAEVELPYIIPVPDPNDVNASNTQNCTVLISDNLKNGSFESGVDANDFGDWQTGLNINFKERVNNTASEGNWSAIIENSYDANSNSGLLMNTGYAINSGDIITLSFDFLAKFGWTTSDKIKWRLFALPAGATLSETQVNTIGSDFFMGVIEADGYQENIGGSYTVPERSVGQELWMEFVAADRNVGTQATDDQNHFSRIDNVNLQVCSVDADACLCKDFDQPNIITIVVDDLGWADLSANPYSAPDAHTPNMNRIADEGVFFPNAYTTGAVCSPSRSGLITGLYQNRWDTLNSWSPGIPDDVKTLAEMLQSGGYRTGMVGKNDYGTTLKTPDTFFVRSYPANHGFDYFDGFSAHAHDFWFHGTGGNNIDGGSAHAGPFQQHDYTVTPHVSPQRISYSGADDVNNLDDDPDSYYSTDLITDNAMQFVEQQTTQGNPFYLNLNYNSAHHLTPQVPQKYLDLEAQRLGWTDIPPEAEHYDPNTDTPSNPSNYRFFYQYWNKVANVSNDYMRKYYLANVRSLDENIGRLLDQLDSLGIADNTIILFTSDNGGPPETGANNGPLTGSKYNLFEGGIRVPIMLRWSKEIPAGMTYEHIISTLDAVPTFLEAANMESPYCLDGHSLIQPIKNNLPTVGTSADPTIDDRTLFWQWKDDNWAVRKGQWKLVQTGIERNGIFTDQVFFDSTLIDLKSLFDLNESPSEVAARMKNTAHPDLVMEFENLYQNWIQNESNYDFVHSGQYCNSTENNRVNCIISAEDFESDWGIWNSGGNNARRDSTSAYASSGAYTAALQDNTNTSTITTSDLDLTAYSNIQIDFNYVAVSMDNPNEDFWLQISTDGGSTFTTLQTWASDIDFTNNIAYAERVEVQGPFTANTQLRFRCDASGSADDIYLDDIEIKACNNCTDVNLHANLEGTYDPAFGEMTTQLNTRGLLPGQTPTSNLVTPTPAGQPYNIAPWNYMGTEGANWTDANYTGDETDWVLVSFRTGIEKNTEVGMTAALLTKDGSIKFPNRCALSYPVTNPMYVVLEHRNHIGIMTPQAISVVGNTLTYDFRLSDSYRDATSFGQKQLPTGEWSLFAGDADQLDFPSFDINGTDKTLWFENNGIFDYYQSPDFNLDGDINGQDKSLWFENNGISSRVPK